MNNIELTITKNVSKKDILATIKDIIKQDKDEYLFVETPYIVCVDDLDYSSSGKVNGTDIKCYSPHFLEEATDENARKLEHISIVISIKGRIEVISCYRFEDSYWRISYCNTNTKELVEVGTDIGFEDILIRLAYGMADKESPAIIHSGYTWSNPPVYIYGDEKEKWQNFVKE